MMTQFLPRPRGFPLVIMAVLSVLSLVMASTMSVRAYADPQDVPIQFSNLTLTKKKAGDDPLVLWDFIAVSMDWNAPKGVKENGTFTVKLPEVLLFQNRVQFDLVAKAGTAGFTSDTTGGTCEIDADHKGFLCTFNDKFVNKDDVRGTMNFEVQASKTTTNNSVDFSITLPGVEPMKLQGELPGGKGIAVKPKDLPDRLLKVGWPRGKNDAMWQIQMSGTKLKELNAPTTLRITDVLRTVADGKGASTIDHKFADPSDDPKTPRAYAHPVAGNTYDSQREFIPPGLSVNFVKNSDQKVTFELTAPTGGWQDDHLYMILYRSQGVDPNEWPADGDKVTNTVTIEGINAHFNGQAVYKQSASGTITGVDRGSYAITKVLDPNAPKEVKDFFTTAPNTAKRFKFRATYTDKNGVTKVKNHFVSVGQTVTGDEELKAGTKVVIREVPPLPEIPGFSFANPTITATTPQDSANVTIANSPPEATITIEESRNIGVTFTNSTAPVAPAKGTFKLKKKVIKPVGYALTSPITLRYTCAVAGDDSTQVTGELKVTPPDNNAGLGEFSVETDQSQPIVMGSECRVTEEAVAVPGLVWVPVDPTNATVVKTFTFDAQVTAPVEVTNTYEQAKRVLKLKKQVQPVEILNNQPHSFEFNYRCVKPNGSPQEIVTGGPLTVTVSVAGISNEVETGPIPVGYECTFTENPQTAAIGTISPVSQPVVKLVKDVDPDNYVVVATNSYKFGSFEVVKDVVNNTGVAVDFVYSFDYTCTKDGSDNITGTLAVTEATKKAISPRIPSGYVCTVVETKPTFDESKLVWTSQVGPAVKITDGKVQQIPVTNTFTSVQGRFAVVKTLKGVDSSVAPFADKKFAFDYECTLPSGDKENGSLSVKGASRAVSPTLPVGSVCTVSENDAYQAGYAWQVEKNPQTLTVAANAQVEFVNSYEPKVRVLRVSKKVVNADAIPGVGGDFAFTYRCHSKIFDRDYASTTPIRVPAGGQYTVEGIPEDAVCTVTELNPTVADADVAVDSTAIVGGPFTVNPVSADKDVLVAQNLTFGPTGDATVEVTNTFTPWRGSVTITKALTGSASDDPALRGFEFAVKYVCTKKGFADQSGVVKVSADKPAVIHDVLANATCTVEEVLDDAVATQLPHFSFVRELSTTSRTVTPITAPNGAVGVTVSNHFDELGKVSLVKALEGISSPWLKNKEFTVSASWSIRGEKTTHDVVIRPDAAAVELPPLPVGTVITMQEKLPIDHVFAQWKDPVFSGAEVHDAGSATATIQVAKESFTQPVVVTVTNTVHPSPWWLLVGLVPLLGAQLTPYVPPQPPPAPATSAPHTSVVHVAPPTKGVPRRDAGKKKESRPALARTGADVWWIIGCAVLLIIVGLVVLRRRRN